MAGKLIIEHIISKLYEIDIVNKIYIVTNAKFELNFKKWLKKFPTIKPVEIINDGSKSNDDRLGALGDIHYVINTKNLEEDIIVIAGDNLFEVHLQEIFDVFNKLKNDVILLHDIKDIVLAKQYGVVKIENSIIVDFEEKPSNPKSTLVSTGIYLFQNKTLPLIKKFINQGNNPDKSGSFIEWLYKREKVYACITDKKWYDVGSFEQLENANKQFKG